MGIATINYTIVSEDGNLGTIDPVLTAGQRVYTGIITEVSMNQIPNTTWYEVHVTMIATTE